MNKELICKTCGSKKFTCRSIYVSHRQGRMEETYNCTKCKEPITITYSINFSKIIKTIQMRRKKVKRK